MKMIKNALVEIISIVYVCETKEIKIKNKGYIKRNYTDESFLEN